MKSKEYHFSEVIKLVLLLCVFGYLPVYAQNNAAVTDRLAEQLQSLTKDKTSDLVYLQTSKSIYETEEDVWFKGYVLDAQYFTPSARSKILFVQLIEDKTDKVVWENKYEIENGFVNGHLFLENKLQEGSYTLAAYSSYSYTRNAKEFYALKKIEILKTIKSKVVNAVLKDSTLQFNTFPEGGNLVSGIESTLAFKAVKSNGLPVNVSGTLFENNVPLLKFKSSHAGMGSFLFTPDANKKYHIELTEPQSGEKYSLPQIYQSGKVLQLIRNTKEALIFKISQSATLKPDTTYVRLQVRGVVYSIALGLLKKELTIKIPLKEVPQGIAEVTLFSGTTEPVAERLVYVNQDQKLNIKAELDKSDYNTREKANLKIKVTDQNGEPVVAHLGLSVYDGLYQNKQDSKNILTHYFLSTQLKGNIYDPAYYFNEQNKDRQQALNLLLLTQGWRSYVWDETNLRELGNIPRPILFDELKAKVTLKKVDSKTKESQLQQGIMVFSADERRGTDLLMADATGTFALTPEHLKKGEGGYTYLKLVTPKASEYRMDLKDYSFEEINKERKIKTTLYPIPTLLDRKTEDLSSFADRPEVNKLKEVLITSKKKIVFRDKYIGKLDSLARAMHFTNDYVCMDHKGGFNLSGILNCPFCNCSGDHKKPVEGEKYLFMRGFRWLGEPQNSSLHSSRRNKITYHYPDLTEAQLLELFNIAMIKGYYGKKVFYEPIYDEVTITDSTPDYRNTLYWKPDIITNEQGEATVNFFCSDINSLFTGNIEGVSGEGLLGEDNFEFKVRKKAN